MISPFRFVVDCSLRKSVSKLVEISLSGTDLVRGLGGSAIHAKIHVVLHVAFIDLIEEIQLLLREEIGRIDVGKLLPHELTIVIPVFALELFENFGIGDADRIEHLGEDVVLGFELDSIHTLEIRILTTIGRDVALGTIQNLLELLERVLALGEEITLQLENHVVDRVRNELLGVIHLSSFLWCGVHLLHLYHKRTDCPDKPCVRFFLARPLHSELRATLKKKRGLQSSFFCLVCCYTKSDLVYLY